MYFNQKPLKNLFKISAFAVLSALIFSCEKFDEQLQIESVVKEKAHGIDDAPSKAGLKNGRLALTMCEVDGPNTGSKNTNVTYTATTNIVGPIYKWTITEGETNISIYQGQGTGTATATFVLGANFSSGEIKVDIVSSVNSDRCTLYQTIASTGGGGSECTLPAPRIIEENVCVSGGHPDWRFTARNIEANDAITWSVDHGTVMTGSHDSYVAIRPTPDAVAGFTVFCKIVRTCPDGSTRTRTAYYINYYGNSCGTGETGYTDNWGGGGSGGGLLD